MQRQGSEKTSVHSKEVYGIGYQNGTVKRHKLELDLPYPSLPGHVLILKVLYLDGGNYTSLPPFSRAACMSLFLQPRLKLHFSWSPKRGSIMDTMYKID